MCSSDLFSEPTAYKAYLAKLYAGLAVTGQQGAAGNADIGGIDEGFSQYFRLLWQMQELPTDEAAVSWGDQGIQELNTQIWGSSNSFLGAMYYRVFFQVAMVNQFMRETSDSKLNARGVSTALKDEIAGYRAEARFLRAEPAGCFVYDTTRPRTSFFALVLEPIPRFRRRFGERAPVVLRRIAHIVTNEKPAQITFTILFDEGR